MKLWEYVNKDVKIVDIDDNIWIGKVDAYNSELDNDGVESISVNVNVDGNNKFHKSGLYEFTIDDIKEIEEIK